MRSTGRTEKPPPFHCQVCHAWMVGPVDRMGISLWASTSKQIADDWTSPDSVWKDLRAALGWKALPPGRPRNGWVGWRAWLTPRVRQVVADRSRMIRGLPLLDPDAPPPVPPHRPRLPLSVFAMLPLIMITEDLLTHLRTLDVPAREEHLTALGHSLPKPALEPLYNAKAWSAALEWRKAMPRAARRIVAARLGVNVGTLRRHERDYWRDRPCLTGKER